jgi:NADH-quinone oxidoreductase subunit K
VNIFPYLLLSALLFSIGTIGVIVKKNIIAIFLCIELMLNAVNLAFVAFSRYLNQVHGQIFVFFVMVVAAAEAAVGLAITISLYRNRGTLNVDDADIMKW